MKGGKRTSFVEALDGILQALELDVPITLAEMAGRTGIDRRTVVRIVDFIVDTQDCFAAERVTVLGDKGRKIVLIDDRVDLSVLPDDIRNWYVNKRYFSEDFESSSHSRNESGLEPIRAKPVLRATIEDAIQRVFRVLESEDELSVGELAGRAGINRKTADRALTIITRFQDDIVKHEISVKGNILLARQGTRLEDLDETRMKILLKKRYFPEESGSLSDSKGKSLMRLA
ncbi:MAG: hypothetical protein ACXACG_17175 [Candidatus Thorarchaeota archaeon]